MFIGLLLAIGREEECTQWGMKKRKEEEEEGKKPQSHFALAGN